MSTLLQPLVSLLIGTYCAFFALRHKCYILHRDKIGFTLDKSAFSDTSEQDE